MSDQDTQLSVFILPFLQSSSAQPPLNPYLNCYLNFWVELQLPVASSLVGLLDVRFYGLS